MNTIAIASDHAGVELKALLKNDITRFGFEVKDLGTNSAESVDYPDYAKLVADWLKAHPKNMGVLICGSGIGMSIAANRYLHVRAALVENPVSAALARKHNDANVLCLGARVVGTEMARSCLKEFLQAEFEGGRHKERVKKLSSSSGTP